MPNWCECDLRIYGRPEEISRFKKYATGEKSEEYAVDEERLLSEQRFIPYPERFRRMDQAAVFSNRILDSLPLALRLNMCDMDATVVDGYNRGGYEWCIENWGTKWGICEARIVRENEHMIFYQFECAWSPCTPVIHEMSRQFPSLLFDLKYYEQGNCFQGHFRASGGEAMLDIESKYYGQRGG